MSELSSGWGRELDEPSRCRKAASSFFLRDAANYSTALPAKEATLAKWRAAIEALILVADLGGPTMFARIGVVRALNRNVERVFNSSGK